MRNSLTIACLLINYFVISQEKFEVYSDKSSIDLKQEISLQRQFLDSLFYQGKVYFKNGKSTGALMNYNLLENGISFVKDDKVLLLTGLDEISFVTYNRRVFIPHNNYLLEQLDIYTNNYALLLRRTTNINTNATKGAYGMNSQSSNIGTYSSLGNSNSLQSFNDINKEIRIDVIYESLYYIKTDKGFKSISKIKDLMKLFPEKKDGLLLYIDQQNLG